MSTYLTSFSISIKVRSYETTSYHSFIGSIKNYFGGVRSNGAPLVNNF